MKSEESKIDKKEINLKFVALRKHVKTAQLIMIRKLIKKITAMKAKKSKNPEVEKKIQSLLSQVQDMKKLGNNKQCDKVSAFALKNTLNLQQLLSDSQIDSRTKAMARLIFFKTMKNSVNEFKKEFPDYLTWLTETKKEVKLKKDKKKKDKGKPSADKNEASEDKVKNVKNKKSVKNEEAEAEEVDNESEADSEDDEAQENDEDSEDQDGSDENEEKEIEEKKAKNKKRLAENRKVEGSKAKKIKKIEPEDDSKDEVDQENNEDSEDQDDTNKNQDKSDRSIKKSITKSNKINKKKMTVEITDDVKDNNNDDDDIEDKKRKDANKVKCKRVIDPFFVSDDNNPVYLDIPLTENDKEEKDKDLEVIKAGRKDFVRVTGVERNAFHKEKGNNRDGFGRGRGRGGGRGNDRNDFNKGRNDKFNKFNSNSVNKFDKDRSKFNNAKSKFDDNKFNKGKMNESRYGNKSTDLKKGTNNFKQDKTENNAELHPSWAARKKQQDILKQGFQGKKIVFNDD